MADPIKRRIHACPRFLGAACSCNFFNVCLNCGHTLTYHVTMYGPARNPRELRHVFKCLFSAGFFEYPEADDYEVIDGRLEK